MTDTRAIIVLQAAVSLISAGGHYQHHTLNDAVDTVMGTLGSLDHWFTCHADEDDEPEEGGTLQ